MNLLAQLLPAIREIRAPLLGGYLWLLSGWLAFEDDVPVASQLRDDTTWESLDRLQGLIGALGVAVAVSVAAYLVGSLVGEAIELMLDRVFKIRRDALLQYAAMAPETRYQLDPALSLFAEADLRFHIAFPLLLVGALVDPFGNYAIWAIVLLLLIHGWRLAKRAVRTWASVAASVTSSASVATSRSRADLRVRKTRRDRDDDRGGSRSYLTLENAGPGIARSIDLEEITADRKGVVLDQGITPIPELRAGDSVDFPLLLTMGNSPAHIQVRLEWTDDTGSRMEVQSVTLGY